LQTANASLFSSGEGRISSSRRRSIAFWLFVTFQFFYLLTSSGRVRTPDEYNTLYTTESLVLHHTTAVPQAIELNNFYGRLDIYGLPRAAYPPGQALLCTPWYAVGYYLLARLPGVPHSPPNDDTDLIVAFAACLSSATFAALTVTFFFLLLIGTGIGIPLRVALMATAMLGLATPIFAYSAWLFSEPLSAAIFTGVAYLLFVPSDVVTRVLASSVFAPNADSVPLRTAAVAGLILGLSTLVRPTSVLAVIVFAIAILMCRGDKRLRTAMIFCAAAAIGVAVLLAHNAILFGSPFSFGYPAAAEADKRLNSFGTPILTGLYGFLLSPGKSIFLFAPPVLLAIAGLAALWRRNRPLATLAVLLPLANLFFFSKYSQWEGGYCVGPRYLVPSLVFLCLGLGPALANAGRRTKVSAAVLFVAGALVQVVSIATSFMEDQVPRGHYYDANWTYRLGYSFSGPIHLLSHYLNNPQPAKLGFGWDRWFIFLAKAGISHTTLASLGALMVTGFAVGLFGLVRSARPFVHGRGGGDAS
jgi:hypothetical protein